MTPDLAARARAVAIPAAVAAGALVIVLVPHFAAHWLGLDNAGGPVYLGWSGVVGTSVFGGIGAVLKRTAERHHGELLAQAARHHRERLEQAQAHHEAHMAAIGEQQEKVVVVPSATLRDPKAGA